MMIYKFAYELNLSYKTKKLIREFVNPSMQCMEGLSHHYQLETILENISEEEVEKDEYKLLKKLEKDKVDYIEF